MKKKLVLLTTISATVIVGSLAAVLGLGSKDAFDPVKASDDKVITWTKDTGKTATTSLGNSVTIGDRYSNWTFGGDYLAEANTTYAFIDNFTRVDSPFRKISSFTVVYTADNPLYFKLINGAGYFYNGPYVSELVSGKKYELGSEDIDYNGYDPYDTYRYFHLKNTSGHVQITSITIEYTCS